MPNRGRFYNVAKSTCPAHLLMPVSTTLRYFADRTVEEYRRQYPHTEFEVVQTDLLSPWKINFRSKKEST